MNSLVRGPSLRPLLRSPGGDRLPETAQDVLRSLERIGERMRGEYVEDEWGFDEEFAEAAYPFLQLLYSRWWRVEAAGLANVPSHGRAMLVSDRADGLVPLDAAMVTGAIMKEHPLPRWPRPLVRASAFELPYLSFFMRRVGGVAASPQNAQRLLEQNHLVIAFQEGVGDEYMEVARRTGSPLIRVSLSGSAHPQFGPLGSVPLPSHWRIEFGEPVDPGDRGRIRETIQARL